MRNTVNQDAQKAHKLFVRTLNMNVKWKELSYESQRAWELVVFALNEREETNAYELGYENGWEDGRS